MACYFFVVALCFLQITIGFSQEQPGLKLRITRSGLDYANQVASKILNDQIHTLHIPDIDQGDIKASNMHITSYNPPAFVYGLTPPSTFSWGITNAGITIEGQVRGCKKIIVRICKTFDVKVSANGVSLNLAPKLGRKPDGQPTIVTADAQISIGNLDLNVSGGILGWIVNLFRNKIADKLKSMAESKISEVARNFLLNDANAKLATFPIQTDIGHYFALDYGLSTDPTVTGDYLEVAVKGRVSLKGSSAVSPYPYTPLAANTPQNKMFFAWLSDKIINDLGYFAHTANVTKRLITKDTSSIGQYLKLKCDPGKMCLGSILPDVVKTLPPNVDAADLFLGTTTPPTLRVNGNGTTTLTVNGTMDLYAMTPDQKAKIPIALVQFLVEPQLKVTVENLKLTGQVSIAQLNMHVLDSKLSPDMIKMIESGLPALGKQILERLINEHLKDGILIPLTKGVEFLNPQIRLLERTAQVETDVKYNG